MQLEKSPSLLATLDALKGRWGDQAFHVVDHWEGNLDGVGIARTDNHSTLVYIEVSAAMDSYFVELERAPEAGSELPYESVGRFDAIPFDKLSSLVAKHLGLAVT